MFKHSFTGCWILQVSLGGGVPVQQGSKYQPNVSQGMVQEEFSIVGTDEKFANEQQ